LALFQALFLGFQQPNAPVGTAIGTTLATLGRTV